MTDPIMKAADARTPMLSQVGNLLRQSGILQEKPATIVKRVIAKGKVLDENVRKFSSVPPDSSHHEGLVVRKRGKIDTPKDDTNPKLAGARAMLKEAVSQRLVSRAIHGRMVGAMIPKAGPMTREKLFGIAGKAVAKFPKTEMGEASRARAREAIRITKAKFPEKSPLAGGISEKIRWSERRA